MKAFKAYDIRGVYNQDFTKDDVYRIGYFLPKLLNAGKILVGRDARISSPEIYEYLTKGIIDSGKDVYDAGLTTTPMIYWGTAKYGFDASVQITASHNPKDHNGLKISRTDALPVGYDTGLSTLEEMVLTDPLILSDTKGKITNFPIIEDYISFLKEYQNDVSNLNIAVDCSNGMASLLIKDILGLAPSYIYDSLDGTFPNHAPNPLDPENIKDLQALVKDKRSDIGIIFDGDADRVMFIDEKGRFVSPDLLIAVLAHHFLKEKTGKVLIDIRTSRSVAEYIKEFGGEIEMWRVGRAFAALKLREIDGIYGGELAGHYYFRDFYYSDSGILACIIILNIISKFKTEGISFSHLIDQIIVYANSGEINFRIEKKSQAMEKIKDYFCNKEYPINIYDFDGYRIEFQDWWFNIRPSNTEPYLRFIAEAKSQSLLDNKVNMVKKLLKEFV